MNQRITTTLILIGIIATAGCSTTQPVSGSAVSPQAARHSASTTLDQYRRIHAAFKELQRQAEALQERLATAGDETEELYARLAKEQKLRREAILQLESAKAEIDAAAHRQRTIDTLRAALDSTRAQLAATGIELKARREELMKIVLGQQEWNEFILEKLKAAAVSTPAAHSGASRDPARQPTMRTACFFCLVLIIAMLCSACARPRATNSMLEYTAKAGHPSHQRRIAIFPIEKGPAPKDSARLITQVLTTAFSQRFDVSQIRIASTGIIEPEAPTLIDDLLLARDEYGADAVLSGKIIDYRTHDPPSITMSLKLISTTDGELLWSGSGTIDASHPDIEWRVKQYFRKLQESDRSLFGWRTIILAERRYVQFVANEFLLTISPYWRP